MMKTTILGFMLVLAVSASAAEESSYTITPYTLPDGAKIEASGLAEMPDGRLAVACRKGEIWILDHPEADPDKPDKVGYHRFASGLHELLGLAWNDGALYTMQRSELTRVTDTDGDGVADLYECVSKGWGVSGNYHEYAYGPVVDKQGDFWISLNVSLGNPVKMPGYRETERPWRGWGMKIGKDGALEPMCAGFRSPSGIGSNAEGDVFVTDQQGNWWGTNPLLHLRKGAFFGHGDTVVDTKRPESPVKDPGKLPQEITVVEASQKIPGFALPAVWFPYVKMGQSPTGFACDQTAGRFGPFDKQLFVGEFVLSGVNRVFLEKVDGEYQGACFRFIDGVQCGVLRVAFLKDGSMIIGETNRGWNSQGSRSFGLERVRWNGKVPFEVEKMEAKKDGFLLTFTEAVDPKQASQVSNYEMSSYTYLYHQKYGSEEVQSQPVSISKVELTDEGKAVRLHCDGLREGFVHELHLNGIKSSQGRILGHPEAYYTLNKVPK